jgi:hypothetical protein
MKSLTLIIAALSLGFLAEPEAALAQGAVQQVGPITKFDVAAWIADHQIETASKTFADNGRGVNPFHIYDAGSANGLCLENVLTSGNYLANQLCLGHSASGSPIFTFGGTQYPLISAGGGTVTGAVTTTQNEVASWNNTTGTLLRQGAANITGAYNAAVPYVDAGMLTANTGTLYSAAQIYGWAFTAGLGNGYVDALRGVAYVNAASTASLVNGVAGYVMVSAPKGAGGYPTSVALFGVGIADVNSSQVWGLNTLLSDNRGQTVSAGTGKLLYNELDFNVTSPNTDVFGLVIQGASLAQPAVSNAFLIGPLALGPYNSGDYSKQWSSGVQIDDNVTALALNIGIGGATKAAGAGSQIIQMNYMDNSAVEQHAYLQAITVGQEGGANAAFYVSNQSATIVTDVGVKNGGFFTQDSATGSGMTIGRLGTTGASLPSQLLTLGYTDGASAAQNYHVSVDSTQQLNFTGTGATSKYLFNGNLSAIGSVSATTNFALSSNIGVTCGPGAPTAAFKTFGGIVTAC